MKTAWRILIVTLLVFTLTAPIFISPSSAEVSGYDENFYVGVTFGSNSVTEAKQLIDKVSSYTNLFIVDSWDISGAPNSTALDEICDYAVRANMYFMVYFYMIYYNATINIRNFYNASTWDAYGVNLWHISWLSSARERWGNKFLGVYLYDEPGGKQIDKGYWAGNTTTFSGAPVRVFANVSSYDDAANRFVSSLSRNRGMQILTNSSFPQGLNYTTPAFTSDYALYWFDYKAGYNAVFAELGGTRGISSKIQQIALCRGAAKSQKKDWGAIITWATDNPPSPESGSDMLQDLTMAYNAGAKYILVFNFQMSGYGGLTDEHFNAIKQFWTNIHSSSDSHEKYDGQVALVLPSNYGWGMRNPNDTIWGLWPADNKSVQIWENTNKLIDKYGLKLDIVYDDPQFEVNGKYAQTYLWNSTIFFDDLTALSNSASNGFFILTAAAVPLGAVTCLSVFLLMRRRKPRRPVELCVQESISNSNQNEVLKETFENDKRTVFKEFKQTLSASINIVDPLFDLLMSLQSEVDWNSIEDCLKRSEQATMNSGHLKLNTEKLIFQNLSFAIKAHQKKEIARETQLILKLFYENAPSLSLKNHFSKDNHPDSTILKNAVSAYFTLNDILLGQIVGDEEIGKEKIELANFLRKLSEETQMKINSGLLREITDKLSEEKTGQTAVAEVRALLIKQLQEFLD